MPDPPVGRAFDARICEAIRELRVLAFDYGGRPRLAQPYCHGVTTTGLEVVRAVQVGGESRSGGFGYGKLWAIGKMARLRVTETPFLPDDPNYNPDDSALVEIHCRVPPRG